jgi:hypothetical protein
MDRDGIRTLSPAERRKSLCGTVLADVGGVIVRCHVRAKYATPLGRRCCKHALLESASS